MSEPFFMGFILLRIFYKMIMLDALLHRDVNILKNLLVSRKKNK